MAWPARGGRASARPVRTAERGGRAGARPVRTTERGGQPIGERRWRAFVRAGPTTWAMVMVGIKLATVEGRASPTGNRTTTAMDMWAATSRVGRRLSRMGLARVEPTRMAGKSKSRRWPPARGRHSEQPSMLAQLCCDRRWHGCRERLSKVVQQEQGRKEQARQGKNRRRHQGSGKNSRIVGV